MSSHTDMVSGSFEGCGNMQSSFPSQNHDSAQKKAYIPSRLRPPLKGCLIRSLSCASKCSYGKCPVSTAYTARAIKAAPQSSKYLEGYRTCQVTTGQVARHDQSAPYLLRFAKYSGFTPASIRGAGGGTSSGACHTSEHAALCHGCA